MHMRHMQHMHMQVLSDMPSTTRQDQQALEGVRAAPRSPSSFHGRCLQLAVQWRMHYKRTLARAVKQARHSRAALLKSAEQ